MPVWKKNLILVWLSQFFGFTGYWFAMPFIPYYIQELGATEAARRNLWIALYSIAACVSVGMFSPIWGSLADRYGRKLMVLRANFCNALIIPLMGFAPNLFLLVFLRFMMGVFSGSSTAAMTLVSSGTPQNKRGFALGSLSSATYSGTMAGCFFGGFVVDALGYKAAFFICALFYLLAGLLILIGVNENFTKIKTSFHSKDKKQTFLGLDVGPLRLAWVVLALILVMAMARQFDTAFLPVLVQKIHGSIKGAATWTGIISSVVAVAGMLSGPILGSLADKFSAPKVALISAFCAGIFMLPQGLARNMGTLMGGRFMMVFFAGGLDPVFQIWLAKSTPDKIRGVIFGWALSAKCGGWMLAAAGSGCVATFLGVRWIYAVGCCIFILLMPMIVFATKKLSVKS